MKTRETGISLHGSSGGQPEVGLSLRDFERRLKGSLEVERPSLCGIYMKGNWMKGFVA